MHLNIYIWNIIKSTYHNYAKLIYKYMKAKHQVELLYFQVNEGLMCMGYNFNFSYSIHNLSKF
jgi:hypothetical protein